MIFVYLLGRFLYPINKQHLESDVVQGMEKELKESYLAYGD